MSFTVSLIESADISTITTIQWAALRDNPLVQTLYPRGPTPALADFTAFSYQRATRYPAVRIIKATDDQTGQIVAFAKWIMYRQDLQELEQGLIDDGAGGGVQGGGAWGNRKRRFPPPDCYTRALDEWNDKITRVRLGIMSNRRHLCMSAPKHSLACYFACYSKNLCVLDILHTHPSQQGKGAGALLVKWGTDIADRGGVQCYAETPAAGHALFHQCFFEEVTEMSMDLGKYKEGHTEYKHTVMIRPPFGMVQPERAPPVPPKVPHDPEPPLIDVDHIWETSSEADTEESPSYTAEARMLELRSSASTGSPRFGSVSELRRTASARDLRSSVSTLSVPKFGSVSNARPFLVDKRYSASTRDIPLSASVRSSTIGGAM